MLVALGGLKGSNMKTVFFFFQEGAPKSEGPKVNIQPSTPTSPKPRKSKRYF